MPDPDFILPRLEVSIVRTTEGLFISLDDIVSWLGSCQVDYKDAPQPARETLRNLRDVFVLAYQIESQLDEAPEVDDDDEAAA